MQCEMYFDCSWLLIHAEVDEIVSKEFGMSFDGCKTLLLHCLGERGGAQSFRDAFSSLGELRAYIDMMTLANNGFIGVRQEGFLGSALLVASVQARIPTCLSNRSPRGSFQGLRSTLCMGDIDIEQVIAYADVVACASFSLATLQRARARVEFGWQFAWQHCFTEKLNNGNDLALLGGMDASGHGGANYEVLLCRVLQRSACANMHVVTQGLNNMAKLPSDRRWEQIVAGISLMSNLERFVKTSVRPVFPLPGGEGKFNQRWACVCNVSRLRTHSLADAAKLLKSASS